MRVGLATLFVLTMWLAGCDSQRPACRPRLIQPVCARLPREVNTRNGA